MNGGRKTGMRRRKRPEREGGRKDSLPEVECCATSWGGKDEATQSDVEGAVDEKEEQLRAVTYRWLQRRPWIAGLEQQLCPAAKEGARADDAADSQTGFWKMRLNRARRGNVRAWIHPAKPQWSEQCQRQIAFGDTDGKESLPDRKWPPGLPSLSSQQRPELQHGLAP